MQKYLLYNLYTYRYSICILHAPFRIDVQPPTLVIFTLPSKNGCVEMRWRFWERWPKPRLCWAHWLVGSFFVSPSRASFPSCKSCILLVSSSKRRTLRASALSWAPVQLTFRKAMPSTTGKISKKKRVCTTLVPICACRLQVDERWKLRGNH